MAYVFDGDDEDAPYVVIEKRSGSVSSFLLGAAIGAGFALLFAPQSGVETRRGITRRARRVKVAAQDAVEDAADRVADGFSEARRQVEERIEAARAAVHVKTRQVTRAMEAGREAAQQARDELERRITETKAAYGAGASVARTGRATRSTASAGGASPGVPAVVSTPLPPAAVKSPAPGTGGPATRGTPGIPEE